jgi:hypothetical protein
MGSTKPCQVCERERPLGRFSKFTKNGKEYRRNICHACKQRIERRDPRVRARYNAAQARQRKNNPVRSIWTDSRKTDRKKNRENDLTKEFIAEQIAKGCSYCGETKIRMTLDRIDNTRGHTMDNVVPACIRCNYVRGNMPYEAWLRLRAGLRKARREGLFGDWTGQVRHKGQ